MYYFIDEREIISLQFLVILNLATVFLVFFIYIIFLDNMIRQGGGREIITNRPHNTTRENSVSYNIDYDELYEKTYSDSFPFGIEDKCSICLDEFVFDSDNEVVKTLGCSHYFHEKCLKRWLIIKQNCPNCNNNLVARFIEELF